MVGMLEVRRFAKLEREAALKTFSVFIYEKNLNAKVVGL